MEASLAAALTSAISSMSSARTLQQLRQIGASEAQLNIMSNKFKFIQKCVQEVHNQKLSTQAVHHWLKKVNKLIFFVENTIDKYEYEILQNKHNKSLKKKPYLSLPCRMSCKVRQIMSLLNDVQKEAMEAKITTSDDAIATSHHYKRSDSATLDQVSDSKFVGRATDEAKIIETLCNTNNTGGDMFTIAIVGMAGIGKTTLAKRVYEHETIDNHFGKKFWIKVGEVFDATRIMRDMLPEEMVDLNDSGTIMRNKLINVVKGANLLIVLDDVRSVTQEQLSGLDSLHTVEAAKICILATTRRLKAARTLGASYTHPLQRLSVEESRDLFDFVSSSATPEVNVPDQTICKILDKCYGVPRVIWKTAGSLQEKADVSEWEMMAETELSDLILSTMSLTFNSLPKALRQCFAYCSIFPKGAVIKKSDLLRLWLAQGFLSEDATGHNVDTETATDTSIATATATAEEFFDILLNKSLLQVSTQDEDENAIDCTLDDFAHDLAKKFSRHDLLIIDGQVYQSSSLSDVRHLVISSSNKGGALKSMAPPITLRTLYSMVSVPEKFLSQARSLHVLKLDGIGLEEVPKNIGKLKLLRYLDLSNNPFSYLPESITHLYLLQTLLLIKCENLSDLPKDLYDNLTNLTLLDFSFSKLSSKMVPPTALRSLLLELDESRGPIQLSELGSLTDIDDLCIKGLEHVKVKEATLEARIGKKHRLSALELCWNRDEASDSQHYWDIYVLDGLQPHPDIKRLKLVNYDSPNFPNWMKMMKSENNGIHYKLVKIELLNCKRCLQLPTLGRLRCLRELVIAGMESIKEIGAELYDHLDDGEDNDVLKVFFRALTRLELRDCTSLSDWHSAPTSNAICQAFQRLETLHIINCPNLNSFPTTFPRMKSLLIHGVKKKDWLDNIITESSRTHSIISLVLCTVSELKQLPNELFNCTSLQQLTLRNCAQFNSWPSIPWNLKSLKELCIDDCCSLKTPPHIDGSLTALDLLIIRGCSSLIKAPENLNRCTSLTKMAIANCVNLAKVPNLKELTRLEVLDILDCGKLRSLQHLGLHSLTCLRTMRVDGVHNRSNYFPQCTSVEELWLTGTNDKTCLPSQLGHFSQLKILKIGNFVNLEIVPDWICELKSLRKLILLNCEQLKQLPSRTCLLQLRKLDYLRIKNCAILEDRYDKDIGQEWNSICHVRHIYIRGRWLQGDRDSLLQAPLSTIRREAEQVTRPLTVDGDDRVQDVVPIENVEFRWPIPGNGEPGSTSIPVYVLVACLLIIVMLHMYRTNFTEQLQKDYYSCL